MIPSRYDNPFSTCWTKPGAMPFVFPSGISLERLLDRLKESNWTGQIIGPHGVGKSTLLAMVIAQMREQGHSILLTEIHGQQRRLPASFWKDNFWSLPVPTKKIVVVDGYEQLGRWQRYRLSSRCKQTACGLIVTTHTENCLPMLVRLSPSLPTVQKLVKQLVLQIGNDDSVAVTKKYVAASFQAHNGNVREIFFDLYDRHDQQVRKQANRSRTACKFASY